MRKSLLSRCLLCGLLSAAPIVFADNGCALIVLPPMPASGQYPSLLQYQEALQAWQVMAQSLIARSTNVQPPYMPQPYQYRSFPQYQEALQIWQNLYR
jgi:hypothetical protein